MKRAHYFSFSETVQTKRDSSLFRNCWGRDEHDGKTSQWENEVSSNRAPSTVNKGNTGVCKQLRNVRNPRQGRLNAPNGGFELIMIRCPTT